eukprot:696329_1
MTTQVTTPWKNNDQLRKLIKLCFGLNGKQRVADIAPCIDVGFTELLTKHSQNKIVILQHLLHAIVKSELKIHTKDGGIELIDSKDHESSMKSIVMELEETRMHCERLEKLERKHRDEIRQLERMIEINRIKPIANDPLMKVHIANCECCAVKYKEMLKPIEVSLEEFIAYQFDYVLKVSVNSKKMIDHYGVTFAKYQDDHNKEDNAQELIYIMGDNVENKIKDIRNNLDGIHGNCEWM